MTLGELKGEGHLTLMNFKTCRMGNTWLMMENQTSKNDIPTPLHIPPLH